MINSNDAQSFAAKIRERYPEGLTGIIAVGGTRTTHILRQHSSRHDPGHIEDFAVYARDVMELYVQLITSYFDLGGQNLILPVLSFQSFYERGEQYNQLISRQTVMLTESQFQEFYQDNDIDPYFAGIDTLLHLPEDQLPHQLGAVLDEFQRNWTYRAGRRKLVWEIAPIPLFSFWRAQQVLGEAAQAELQRRLDAATDMETMYRELYAYYAKAAYGTELPVPHFYLGSNRNGDLKLRSMVPIALLCGSPTRLFYTPYPSLFTRQETLQHILEDLAFGNPLRSRKTDYSGQYTSELLQAEYQRVLELSADPLTTLGLLRTPQASGASAADDTQTPSSEDAP